MSTRSKRKVPVAASVLRKRLIRATAARERKKADVKRLSEKLKNALTATLDDIIRDLPEVQKMAVRAAVMQQAAKSPRGHRYTADWLMIGDHKLNYNHYEQLYDAEKKVEIKVVPKLTEYHIKPQKLQAMNVRLATQLFSRSVAIGFKVYRELNVPGFDDTAGTEKVTSLLNDLFDILNAKIPQAGIRKGSPKIKFLEEFLDMLNQTEARKDVKLIASNQTVESLRVTLMSVLSIIEFLHSEGVSYILTAKLNQDPLEGRVNLILNVYSPPKGKGTDFESLLAGAVSLLCSQGRLVFLGDFNAPHTSWGYRRDTAKGNLLEKAIDNHGLQLITLPTVPTRLGNSVSVNTSPDLAFTLNLRDATYSRSAATTTSLVCLDPLLGFAGLRVR
ncbi:hypothetical protein HPB50_007090 [Hyalomma asiaticum]|uniref:Uncharacterized protein n=1 Tax=Hyalomma asiaticum TaxID=266040 RepID=A0ACB7SKE1_HYAAI|nr:hypothetical protein HPB50_007090 [Hyalomma asiaticum]